MTEYHKIQSIYKRTPDGRSMLFGDYSTPEIAYLANAEWEWTEKVDGTNVRIIVDTEGLVTFGGRTDRAQMPTFLMQRLHDLFLGNPDLVEVLPDGGVLYGEGYGPRIQKGGGNYGECVDFVLFDVRVGEWWLQRPDVNDVAARLGLRSVPVVGRGTLDEACALVRGGFKSTWGDFIAEGLVMRPAVDLYTRKGSRIITKIKDRDFAGEDR